MPPKLRQNLPVVMILLFSLLFLLLIHNVNDISQDIGLHLSLGKIVWQQHKIITTNFFSFTTPDFPWFNNTWLSKVFFYLVDTVSGLSGLIIFKALILTLAFIFSFLSFSKGSILIRAIFGVLSIFILIERTDIRPEIFSFLFLGWYLLVLFRKNKSLFWTLPLIQLLWVNTHIYFFLGPIIFFLFLIQQFIDNPSFNRENKKLITIGVIVLLVNIINPLWFKGAIYPADVFSNYGAEVLENYNPFYLVSHGWPGLPTYIFVLTVILTGISFIFNRKHFKNNIFSFLLFVFSSPLAFKMIRNFPVFALSIMPINFKNLYESGLKLESKKLIIALDIALSLLLILVVTNKFYDAASLPRKFGLHITEGPQKAVDFVKANNLTGPIFNNSSIGSFLIWKLPEEKVFVDSRTEAYPSDFLNNVYFAMETDQTRWQFYAKQYKINLVIYDYKSLEEGTQQFILNISKDPNWALIYKDGWAAIFIKRTPENAEVIEKYEIKIQA